MSPAMSQISSTFASGASHLPIIHNHLPTHQRVFSLSPNTISKLNIPDGDSFDFTFTSDGDLDEQGIIDDIREYFNGIAEDFQRNADVIVEGIKGIDWADPESIKQGFDPLTEYLKPIFHFVAEHPWILLPLVIPSFEVFLFALGFRLNGVLAESIAAQIQSRIANVPKDSIFAFFQSVGARGWAFDALLKANFMITVAVIIVAVGQYLIEKGIIEPDKIYEALEKAWGKASQTFDSPHTWVESTTTSGQVTVLNLNSGWVKYGVLASVLIPVMVCAGEGL